MTDPAAAAIANVPPGTPPDDARIAVVSMYKAQDRIHARAVSGWFAAWRWALVWATQIVFYGLPWLQWGDRQAMLFALEARRFYIFGLVLYPQDFIYLTGLLVVSAGALFLFTAGAGRLWCGFACPQTVYTEVFMWVEKRFEGDRNRRIRLDKAPWGFDKLWRRGGKHAVWLAIGLWTGFTFVGYFTPIRELAQAVPSLTFGPWEAFWIGFYGLATYGNAGFLREQVCKYMCPYARFQSVMMDKDTLVITYDPERGEPRGGHRPARADDDRRTKPKVAGLGDCIDCTLCVQVCPTGIDIRDGLQYECIGCGACIDACNGVMDKMQYPRGLIRYDTENAMQQKLSPAQTWRRVLRPRVLIYTAVLLLIGAGLTTSLAMRAPFKVDIVRDRGTLGRLVDNGWIENVYRLQVMNATERPQRYRITAAGLPGIATHPDAEVVVPAAEALWLPMSVRVPPQTVQQSGPGAHAIRFTVERLQSNTTAADVDASRSVTEASTFVVPR